MSRKSFPFVLLALALPALFGVLHAHGSVRVGTAGGDRVATLPMGSGASGGAHLPVTPPRTPDAHEALLERVVSALRSAAEAGRLRDLPSDSALDELSVGRYWHAALALRAEGMARGVPEHVLLLATAEAGWGYWSGVHTLLEGAPWLDTVGGGEGIFLLARALEKAERWAAAADAFERYERVARVDAAERPAARVRGIRARWRAGDRARAEGAMDALGGTPIVRSWLAVDLLRETVEAGDTAATSRLLAKVTDPTARSAVWRAEADALLAAGDDHRALAGFERLRASGTDPVVGAARAAEAGVEVARLRVAAGDTVGVRALFEAGVEAAGATARTWAAAGIIDLGGSDLEETARLAGLLDRAGDGRRALLAYDRAHRMALAADARLTDAQRVERARLMGTVPDRQNEALEEFRALRETIQDRPLAARNLDVWAQMRQRQGQAAAVRTLREWLVADYPESPAAAEIVFMRGYDAENAGRIDEALRHYAAVAEAARAHDRAGQARMRAGQIELSRGNLDQSARTFEAYLEDFPNGRRWDEAAYWAGRVRMELGHRDQALGHLRRVMGEPTSYYAVMAANLLSEPFTVQLPPGVTPREPAWLTEGLARLDVLTDADLERGAEAEVGRLRDLARGDRAVGLRFADALIERGRTIDGINIGWALLAEGDGWDEAVLRVTFPFPHQELVRREAAEWGVDPILLAALIRQESAFKVDIVSRAGAIGLMQVMPATGEQLARTHGPPGFMPEVLASPEVNLHLGSAFLVDMTRRFGGRLPFVLSAYNAGPSRAVRWRDFPEAVDDLRFTERIPFVETRGYVKNVSRNLGIYRVLYGEQ